MSAAALLVLLSSVGQAAGLEFGGERYFLAFNQDNKQTLTQEFLRPGETLENWQRLVGVRHFRAAGALRDVLPEYLKVVRPSFLVPAQIFSRAEGNQNEVLLIMQLAPPDRSYIEHNLHRFVELSDGRGVVGYQFAWKDASRNAAAAKQLLAKHQQAWIDELGAWDFVPTAAKQVQ